jgi:hypothetical protein
MLLRCFLSDFEMIPVAPIITGITINYYLNYYNFFDVCRLRVFV